MDANTFSIVITTIGVGLIPVSILIYQGFKNPVNDFVQKSSKKLLASEEYKNMMCGDPNSSEIEVVKKLYEKFSYIDTIKNRFLGCIISCILSSGFLILAVLLAGIAPTVFTANFINAFYAYGILFFTYFLYCLIYLIRYTLF